MLFNIALNYGGRAEIVDAARRAIAAGHRARRSRRDARSASFLYTAGQPDPDLLIRTSGEMRVSNFLLWQIAYAEIWVTDTLWPDFRRRHLLEAVARLPEARAPLRRHQAVAAVRSRSAPSDARPERRRPRRRRRRRRLVRAAARCFCVVAELLLLLAFVEYAGAGARRAACRCRASPSRAAAMLTCAAFARCAARAAGCRSTSC